MLLLQYVLPRSSGQQPSLLKVYQASGPLYRSVGWLWRNKTVLGPPPADKDVLSVGGAAEAVRAHRLEAFRPFVHA